MNILIVEDHPIVANLYQRIVTNFYKDISLNITIALDAEQALQRSMSDTVFDIALIDYKLPSIFTGNRKSEGDIITSLRKQQKQCKIIVVTAHCEALKVYDIHYNIYPEGFVIKRDLTDDNLYEIIESVRKGEHYISETVKRCNERIWRENLMLDHDNRKIIFCLHNGYKVKDLNKVINLSQSTIQKRVIHMKKLLGVGEEGSLIKEFVSRGLI